MKRSVPVRKITFRYILNLILFTLAALLFAIYGVLPAISANRALHPKRFSVGDATPDKLGLTYENVTLTTRDGLKIAGWYVPSQNGAVIIALHGYNGNRTHVLFHAQLLAKHGYGVMMIDQRCQGDSDGKLYAFGWDADQDVFAALDYLVGRPEVDANRIGILGLSSGAEIAIEAAAGDMRLHAVVSEGAGYETLQDWLIAPEAPGVILAPGMWVFFKYGSLITGVPEIQPLRVLVTQISPTPILFIAAGRDRPFNREFYAVSGEPKQFWERNEPGHVDALFTHPQEYEERVISFLDEALLR